VVAIPVLIAVTLIRNPTWAHVVVDVDPGTHRRRDTKEIRVIARKYEYDPAVIAVKHGDHVRLV
jgi:plastocyanin